MIHVVLISLFACATVEPAPITLAPRDLMETPPRQQASTQPADATTFDACVGPSRPMSIEGRILDRAGAPVAAVPVGQMQRTGSYTNLAVSGDDGTYSVEVQTPAVVSVSDFRSTPGTFCATADLLQGETAPSSRITWGGVDFTIDTTKPLDLVFVDEAGEPVPDVVVNMTAPAGSMFDKEWPIRSDAEGRVRVRRRGELVFDARSPRLINAREGLLESLQSECEFASLGVCVGADDEGPLRVTMTPGLRVKGHVRTAHGEPIAGARVTFTALQGQMVSLRSEADGSFAATVAPGVVSNGSAAARADGYLEEAEVGFSMGKLDKQVSATWSSGTETLDGEEVPVHTFDFVLDGARLIDVGCAGLAGESCAQVGFMVCGALDDDSVRGRCTPHEDRTYTCECPRRGPVVVRGGGLAVEVPSDDTYTWLDFRRFGGGLTGTVPPGSWRVEVRRAGIQYPHGLVQGHAVRTSDGRYRLQGLPPGDYKVNIERSGDLGLGDTMVDMFVDIGGTTVQVADEVVDIGARAGD